MLLTGMRFQPSGASAEGVACVPRSGPQGDETRRGASTGYTGSGQHRRGSERARPGRVQCATAGPPDRKGRCRFRGVRAKRQGGSLAPVAGAAWPYLTPGSQLRSSHCVNPSLLPASYCCGLSFLGGDSALRRVGGGYARRRPSRRRAATVPRIAGLADVTTTQICPAPSRLATMTNRRRTPDPSAGFFPVGSRRAPPLEPGCRQRPPPVTTSAEPGPARPGHVRTVGPLTGKRSASRDADMSTGAVPGPDE